MPRLVKKSREGKTPSLAERRETGNLPHESDVALRRTVRILNPSSSET
jgi:hypothetical protein